MKIFYLIEKRINSFYSLAGIVLENRVYKEQHNDLRRCRINTKTYSIFGYIVFWFGMLLTIGGLCILLINLLHY